MPAGSESGIDKAKNRDKVEELKEIYDDDYSQGFSKNLSCDSPDCSPGVGVRPDASGENTVCGLHLDQSMPGCKGSCRLVYAVWNRDQGIPWRILRQTRHRCRPVCLRYPS